MLNSGKIRGISFCMDEFSIAGSKLDRDLSFSNIHYEARWYGCGTDYSTPSSLLPSEWRNQQ